MDQQRPSERLGKGAIGRRRCATAVALAALASSAGVANAQSLSSSGSQFNRGYGFGYGELNRPVDITTRDTLGNRVFVDGVTQIGSDQSVFANGRATGAADAFAGVGAIGGSASAIGNNLQVNVVGNWNTVIVNSNQTNNGNISATTVLNGKVDIDGK